MNTKAFRNITVFIAFILALGVYTPGRATSQAALTSSEIINIAHFFKPPNMDAASAAKSFNTIVLTNGDSVYHDQLKANGFSSTIPEYFRSEAIQDPGSCTASPMNNQVAYKPGDFCFISQNHPDWFLLDSGGRRIKVTSGGSYYRMDPGNSGWRDFFVTRVIESQNQYGWSALFLDNVEASLGKFFGNNPAKYPDEASYQSAIAGFLQYLDGAMQERFAVAWSETSYLRADQWEDDMQLMEKTQANGKYVILIAPGYQGDLNRQNFAFASYLLISNGKAAFRYSTDDFYREVWLYDNYKFNLGRPLGPRYSLGGAWKRDFTNGFVTVYPVSHTAVISASGPQTPSPIGVFRPSNGALYLKKPNTLGFADITINYGVPGDYPVVGDWDGNGTDTIGVYRNGTFLLRNSNTLGFADLAFSFGQPGDQPIAGDWNGDGIDTIGVYRSSTGAFYLRNKNSSGAPDMSFYLGNVGDVGIAGDWNGDGKDTTGVFRPVNGIIFLKNTNSTGFADISLNYGVPGDKPVVGDWDNNGTTTIGIYRNGRFYLRNSNTNGFADIVYDLGNNGDMPIAGIWDGSH